MIVKVSRLEPAILAKLGWVETGVLSRLIDGGIRNPLIYDMDDLVNLLRFTIMTNASSVSAVFQENMLPKSTHTPTY